MKETIDNVFWDILALINNWSTSPCWKGEK